MDMSIVHVQTLLKGCGWAGKGCQIYLRGSLGFEVVCHLYTWGWAGWLAARPLRADLSRCAVAGRVNTQRESYPERQRVGELSRAARVRESSPDRQQAGELSRAVTGGRTLPSGKKCGAAPSSGDNGWESSPGQQRPGELSRAAEGGGVLPTGEGRESSVVLRSQPIHTCLRRHCETRG